MGFTCWDAVTVLGDCWTTKREENDAHRAVGACALPLRAAAGSRARTAAVAHGEGGLFLSFFFTGVKVMEMEINQEQVALLFWFLVVCDLSSVAGGKEKITRCKEKEKGKDIGEIENRG